MTDLTNMSPEDIDFLKKIGQISDAPKSKANAKKDEE